MSALTDAWLDLYDAQCEFIGSSPVVAIDSVTGVPCIIGEDGANFHFVLGGQASSGQNTIQTLTSAWTDGVPAKGAVATITGLPNSGTITQQVLSTTGRAGVLYIDIGDNSAS